MPAPARLVIVTRKLPDVIETRMMELFDARLNLDDQPMAQAELVEAVEDRRRAGADRHRPDRHRGARRRPARDLRLIANFGTGVDNIDVEAALQARHHGHQHAGRPDRGHGRHDDGADPRRRRAGWPRASGWPARGEWARLEPDLDARPPHLRQAARHRRHGPDRPGAGAARQGLRPVDPLPQPPPRRTPSDRAGARGDLLGEPRPDAGADGHRLGQLPAHAGDLPPALGPPAGAAAAARDHRQHRARRGGRREGADPDAARAARSPAPASTCSSTSRRSTRKLRQLDNVVLLPHMGSATIEGRIDMGEKVIINIKTFVDGHRPPDRVLPSML